MNLGGRGVWFYPDGLSSGETVEFARRIESMGYTAGSCSVSASLIASWWKTSAATSTEGL